MNPHPWRIQRFLAYLLPILLLVCLWAWVLGGYRSLSAERIFADDAVYRHLAISESMVAQRTYGLDAAVPLPFIHDVGWELALAAAQFVGIRSVVALQLLGMFSSLLLLLVMLKLAHHIHPHPLFGYGMSIGLILSAGYLLPSVSGSSAPLLMLLLTAAVARHLNDFATRGVGLPGLSVALIGLAMWIRLESVAVLFLLWIHALSLSGIGPAPRPPLLNGVLRGLNALLILALMMLPWVVWNLKQLSVPIPRMPGVWLTADIWALEGAAAALQATMALIPVGWSESWSAFRQHALPGSSTAKFVWVIGWLALLWQVVRTREDRPYVLLVIYPVLLPLLMAVLYPYLGGNGFAPVMQSGLPLMWLVIAYGWTRVPSLVEATLAPLGIPHARLRLATWIWWGLIGAILLLGMIGSLQRLQRAERLLIRQMIDVRAEVVERLDSAALQRSAIVTDQPGWLVWQRGEKVWDLQGRWSPELIRMVGAQGQYERQRVLRYLHQVGGGRQVWILWSGANDEWQEQLPGARVVMERYPLEPHRPLMLNLNEPVAF